MDLLTVESFDWGYFVFAFLLTLIPFLWVLKRPIREKIYISPFVVFFFIYSGTGVAWDSCDKGYLLYYFIWMVCFSFTLCLLLGSKKGLPVEGVPSARSSFIYNYADVFIYLFIVLKLLKLGLDGKLLNLFSPPSPDLLAALTESEEEGVGLFYYLEHILTVFYFVSLYKYRNKVGKLFIFMFLPFYIGYAGSGYLARSTIMAYLIIFFIGIYFFNQHMRKRIRLLLIIGLPFLVVGLSLYTFIRAGMETDRSVGDAVTLLAFQETSYPIHYTLLSKQVFSYNLFQDYLHWLITLPLPGFLKDTTRDYFFNAIFTERLYGMIRGTQGFYVLLPGVVNEGLFIFGRWLYPLHAIIVGVFVGGTYRIIRCKEEFFLFLYVSVFLASLIARAGTVSAYPVYLKDLLLYEIALLLYSSIKKPKKNS